MTDATDSFKQEENYLQEIADMIDKKLKIFCSRKMGFALLVFEFNSPGIGNYVSNAERESMIKALRETADRLESGQTMPKTIGPAQ